MNLEIGNLVSYVGEEYILLDLAHLNDNGKVTTATKGELYVLLGQEHDVLGWRRVADLDVVEEPVEGNDFFEQDSKSPHLLDLGYSMIGWLDGLEGRPDNDNLPPIVSLLMAIQYDKEGSYGSSWKGKGEYRGIMANIDRKYDRLDKMTDDEIAGAIKSLGQLEKELVEGLINGDNVGESKIDAIADLANYCLLYMTYVREHFPNVFNIWVDKNIPQYLRDKIPFI